MQTQPSVAELVVRAITGGDLSDTEAQRVKTWATENPAHARILDRLRDAQWRMREWERYKEVDKEAVWKRMQEQNAVRPGAQPLPPLNQANWTGGRVVKGRIVKIWALINALILYHNH
jgi:hypothetical protein